MNESADPLTRAIELSMEFESLGGTKSIEEFLRNHESLRDILQPLLEPDATPDQRQILGDFELVRELGRGGMGVVYEAVQILLGRTVALKLLPPHRALSPRSLAMFRREATLAASLDHQGIAKVLELQEVDGQLALAMELIDGVPLDRVLHPLESKTPGTLQAKDLVAATATTEVEQDDEAATKNSATFSGTYEFTAVELTRQVADALAHAHSRGVVHRDVKPGNILITPQGRAVLTDFGLAKEQGMVGMTRTGEFAGTFLYAAPEQLLGRIDEIDGGTDIYALGATLYELLTLRRPLDADSLAELIQRIRREDPVRPSRLNPRVTADLDSVVMCALEKDRGKRYASAEEFATDLGHVLLRTPVRARRLSTSMRATRWVSRNRLVTAFIAVLCIATVAISVFAKQARSDGARIKNLWVGASIDAIVSHAAVAHPARPDRIDELRDLLRKLERDLAMRPELEATIAYLRVGAMLAEAGQRASSRPPHPATKRLVQLTALVHRLTVELRAEGIATDVRSATGHEIDALQREIDNLRGLIDVSNRVNIEDEADAGLHDRFEQQIYQLDRLEQTLLPDLRFRLDWATRVEHQSIGRHTQAWADAAARIQTNPSYRVGDPPEPLTLVPQLGLVPLGPDPSSGLEEFAHLLSGSLPARREHGELPLQEAHGLVFVLIPGGRLVIDSPQRNIDVRLDPFFVAKHEMSRAQWQRLARGLPGLRWRDGGIADVRNHGELTKPINGVTWNMCQGLFERYGLDFPTSIQWEYAASYPRKTRFDELSPLANLRDLAYARGRGVPEKSVLQWDDGYVGLAPITAMGQSPAGLYQIYGNVTEYCRDYYLGLSSPPRAGDGLRVHQTTINQLRVVNGGNFQSTAPMLIGNRFSPDRANRTIGVRPMRRLLPKTAK